MASLRHFSALTKNSLCSDSFASTEKCSDGLVYTRICLKDENYILNYLKILGFYPLLEKFVINSLFKWSLVLKYKSQIKYLLCFKKIAIRFLSKYFKLHCNLDIILFFIKFFSEIEKAICIPT